MVGRNSISVVFVEDDCHPLLSNPRLRKSWRAILRALLRVPMEEVPGRLLLSLAPPLVRLRFKKIHVDLVGPMIVLMLLATVLAFGQLTSGKCRSPVTAFGGAIIVGTSYLTLAPTIAFVVCRLCKTAISFPQLVSLFGYALFGHVISLTLGLLFRAEDDHGAFFLFMTVFSGAATARLALVLLARTPRPAARLILCASVAVAHLLFLLHLYITCLRRTVRKSTTEE